MTAIWFLLSSLASASAIQWTMINVNSSSSQGDAHLVRFPNGENFLIDAGDHDHRLTAFLAESGIKKIQAIIVSHPHKDHYSGIRTIVDSGIRVETVFLNHPDRQKCDQEKPWGCDYGDVTALSHFLTARGVPVLAMTAGKVLYRRLDIRLEVLYAFSERNMPVANFDINDTSAIILLTNQKMRVLFPGDLNRSLGEFLTGSGKRLEAEILKVPHHGTESVAENAFFDRVSPKLAMVPAPEVLWRSERSRRIRKYFESRRIPTFVNGIHGHVTVCIGPSDFRVLGKGERCEQNPSN